MKIIKGLEDINLVQNGVSKMDIKSEIEKIDNYFNNLTIEEFEEVLIRNGAKIPTKLSWFEKLKRWLKCLMN